MDKPSISISNVLDAICGYEDQFLSYALNRNTTCSEHERLGDFPHFNVSAPPSFYCKEIVQQMAKSDPPHFVRLAILFLEKCWREGCFDAPDKEMMDGSRHYTRADPDGRVDGELRCIETFQKEH